MSSFSNTLYTKVHNIDKLHLDGEMIVSNTKITPIHLSYIHGLSSNAQNQFNSGGTAHALLQAEVTQNTTDIADNYTEQGGLIATNTSNVSALDTLVVGNQYNIQTNTNNIASLQVYVNNNTSAIQGLTSSVTANTSAINTQNTNIAAVEASLVIVQDNIDDVNVDIGFLQTTVGTNSTDIDNLETNVASNFSSITALQNDKLSIVDASLNYQPIGDYSTNSELTSAVALKLNITDASSTYATQTTVADGLALKLNITDASSTYATQTTVTDGLALKLNITDASSTYATQTTVTDGLALKLNITDASSTYSTQTTVTDGLALKLNITDASSTYATQTDLNLKLNITDASSTYATQTTVTDGLALKLNITDASSTYATQTTVTDGLALKLNITDASSTYATQTTVTDGLALKLNITDASSTYATQTTVTDGLALKLNITDATTELALKLDVSTATATYTPLTYFTADTIALNKTRILNQNATGGNAFLGNSASTDTQYCALYGTVSTTNMNHIQVSGGDNGSQSIIISSGGGYTTQIRNIQSYDTFRKTTPPLCLNLLGGNVGIAIIPTQKFEVNGNIKFSGSLMTATTTLTQELLSYLDPTSSVQTQIDSKQDVGSYATTIELSDGLALKIDTTTANSNFQLISDMVNYLTTANGILLYVPISTLSSYDTTVVADAKFATIVSLSNYLLSSTASLTYQPISLMSDYLTTSSASSLYQPISLMSDYLTTASASSLYQPISLMSDYLTTASASSLYLTLAYAETIYATIEDLTLYDTITAANAKFATIVSLGDYLTTASASALYQTISGMSAYLTTASASSLYATIGDLASYALSVSTNYATKAEVTALTVSSSSDTRYLGNINGAITQNINVATKYMTWSVNSTSTTQIAYTAGNVSPANSLFHIKSKGTWRCTPNIRVTNGDASNRAMFYLTLIVYSGQPNTSTRGTLVYRYPIGGSVYYRDLNANYDSFQLGGQVSLDFSQAQITAGVQCELVSFRLDAENAAGVINIDDAASAILWEQVAFTIA